MRILIIGGTGQIGARISRHLCQRGDDVYVFGRRPPGDAAVHHARTNFHWVQGDVRDAIKVREAVKAIRPIKIIHLAALLQFACDVDPAQAIEVNVIGTLNVLEAAREFGVARVLFGSSVAVYGQQRALLREDGAIGADVSLYGETKLMGEKLGAQYAKNYGFEFIALRFCGIFGSGAPQSRGMAWVRRQIESSVNGERVLIEDASGDERVQLTYVADAADASVALLDHAQPTFGVYNIAAGHENYISLRQFHALIKSVAPGAGDVEFVGCGRDMALVSIDRLRALGFQSRYSVVDGIRASLEARQGQ